MAPSSPSPSGAACGGRWPDYHHANRAVPVRLAIGFPCPLFRHAVSYWSRHGCLLAVGLAAFAQRQGNSEVQTDRHSPGVCRQHSLRGSAAAVGAGCPYDPARTSRHGHSALLWRLYDGSIPPRREPVKVASLRRSACADGPHGPSLGNVPLDYHPCFVRGATDGLGRRVVQFDSDRKVYAYSAVSNVDWAALSASSTKGEDFNAMYRPVWLTFTVLPGWPIGLVQEWSSGTP